MLLARLDGSRAGIFCFVPDPDRVPLHLLLRRPIMVAIGRVDGNLQASA